MANFSLKEQKSSVEFLRRLGILRGEEVVENDRLRWYGHIERKDAED